MKEQLKEIGARLNDIREIKGFSVDEVAKKLGITPEEYVSYENGEKDFSFGFMTNVASIFEIDVINLLSGHSPKLKDCAIVRRGHEFYVKREGAYDYKHLAYTFVGKKIEPLFVESVDYGDASGITELQSHEGQEFNFVLSGKMLIKVGDVSYELGKGDSIYFNSKIPHGIKVLGDKPAKYLAIVIK